MKSEILEDFSIGFVSEYEADILKTKPGALKDCRNIEINSPIFGIGSTPGTGAGYSMPLYSGSASVAIKKFGVDLPSSKEITVLMRKSNNLITFSEDFEFWTVSGTITVDANAIDGPLRKADTVAATNPTDYLEKLFTGVAGSRYTFSLYILNPITGGLQISIVDDAGTTFATSVAATGWTRLSVSRIVSTNCKVRISLIGAKSIWGAQVELADAPTGYGYTNHYVRPYYIYMRPYYKDGAWTDEWLELTEKRSFKSTSISTTQPIYGGNALYTVSEGSSYFNSWFCRNTTDTPFGANERASIVIGAGIGTITMGTASAQISGKAYVIARFMDWNSELSQDKTNSDNISFLDNAGALVISFDSNDTIRPVMISYVSRDLSGLHANIGWDEFVLTRESMSYYQSKANGDKYIHSGIYLSSGTDITPGGSLDAGSYNIVLTGIFDSRNKIYIDDLDDSVSAGSSLLRMTMFIEAGYLNPRITGVELYIKSGSGFDEQVSYFSEEQLFDSTLVADAATQYAYTFGVAVAAQAITSVDTTQPTLFANLQRSAKLNTDAYYRFGVYVGGRRYVSGIYAKNDSVRFSNIRDITEELETYPYDSDSNFGEILAYSGSQESVTGLARSLTNDLIIFKDRSTLVFEVQSSGGLSRLITAFQGVGCATYRGIASNNDYGVFWYDRNGIYSYQSGIGNPNKISLGKIQNWWSRYLVQYISSSFAMFNRRVNEYWIFINGMVLRYSPDHKNWNIMEFDFTPIGITENLYGDVDIISGDSHYLWGWRSDGTSNGVLTGAYFITHSLRLDNVFIPKELLNISAEYRTATSITSKVYINGETSVRDGNTRVFKTGVNRDSFMLRMSSVCNYYSIRCDFVGDSLLSSLKIDGAILKDRVSNAR